MARAADSPRVPTVTTDDGVTLNYELDGEGETVAFVNEAGLGAWLWGWQHAALTGPYETLVWDMRGTGASDAPPGPYAIGRLTDDLEAVLADAAVPSVHLVGAGLGGMVALTYAKRYNRVDSLVLADTAASGDAVDAAALESLFAPLDDETALHASLEGAFSGDFFHDRPEMVERIVAWRTADDAGPDAREAQATAMLDFEMGDLYEITLPALVLHGDDDPVVPRIAGEQLAADLPRGEFEPAAGRHLPFVEHARAVNDRLFDFLG